jgi:hypothetical protein
MTTVDHQGVSPLCARLSQRREGADVTFHALLARSVRAGLRDSALLSRVGARESSVQRLFSRNGGEGSFSSAGSYGGARRPSGSGFSWITMPPTEVEAPEQAVRQRRSWWSAPKQGSPSTIQRVASRARYRSTTARSIVPSVVRPSVGPPRFVESIDESTPAVQTSGYSQDFSPEIAVASRMVQSSATSDYLNPSAVRVAASRAEVGRVTTSRRSQLPTVIPAVLASPIAPEIAASSFDTEVAHTPSVASVVSPAPSPVSVAASRAEIGRAVPGRRSQLPTVIPAVLSSPVTPEVVSDAVENIGVRTRSSDGTVVSSSIEVAVSGAASGTPALRAPAPSPVSVAASRAEIGRAVPGRRSQLPTVVPAVLASPVAPEVAASSFDTEVAHTPSVASVVSPAPSPVSVAASRAEIGRAVAGRRSQLPTVIPAVLASSVAPEVVSDAVENMGVHTRSSDGTVVPSSVEVAASGTPALRVPAPSPVSVAASRAEIGRAVPGRRSQLPTVVPAVLASPVAPEVVSDSVGNLEVRRRPLDGTEGSRLIEVVAGGTPAPRESVPSLVSVAASQSTEATPVILPAPRESAPSPVSVAASRAEIGRTVPGRRSQLPTVVPTVLASPATPEVSSETPRSGWVEATSFGTRAVRASAPSPVSVAASRAEIGRAVPGRRSQLPTVVPAVLASSREDNIRFPGRAPVAHALSREHLGLQSETGNSMLPVVTPRFGFLDSANAPSVESSVPARTRRSGWAQPIAGKEPKTAAVQSVQRRRTQAQRSIQTELVRATTTEAVAKLASERGEAMNRLANDLPSPTRRLVRKLVKAGVKAASAQRKQSRSKSSSSWAPAHLNRSASGASMDGIDGIGSSGVMKLASKLQGLIHLAEVQNRRSEAQQAVRMAEEAAAAETLGSATEATSSGATSTIDDLRRDVLDAVMADLERLQMRSEEDPDGVELWW